MKLRLTPEIRFIEDESLERGSRVKTNLVFLLIETFYLLTSIIYVLNLDSILIGSFFFSFMYFFFFYRIIFSLFLELKCTLKHVL